MEKLQMMNAYRVENRRFFPVSIDFSSKSLGYNFSLTFFILELYIQFIIGCLLTLNFGSVNRKMLSKINLRAQKL